jgi:predicted permease
MRAFDRLRAHLHALTSRRRIERDIDREMAFHLEMETERLVSGGLSPEEARRLAAVSFGGQQRFREETREAAASPLHEQLDEVARDLRYAIRSYVLHPSFTLTVLLTLALGIGATTVIFSVADHVVLRALPYANAHRLLSVQVLSDRLKNVSSMWAPNAAHYLAWKQECTACQSVIAIRSWGYTLTGVGDPAVLAGARVSEDFLSTLGAHAEVGRVFAPGDDRPGNEHLAVISDALWRERFGEQPDIVGRTITLDNQPWTVVGVVAPEFHMFRDRQLGDLNRLPTRTDLFVPLALSPRERTTPGEHDYGVIVLAKPDHSAAAVREQLDQISARNAASLHDDTPSRAVVEPLKARVIGAAGRPLVLLLLAVGALLLIMCVNLASLFLARSAARRREWAVRVALGAGRTRLVRQAITETVLLACAGGAVGAALSGLGLKVLIGIAPADLPRLDQVVLDGRVLAVTLLVSILVGLGLGIVPAFRLGSTAPSDVLSESSRGTTVGPRGARASGLLIGSQVAISALLLVSAGLFLESFERAIHADRGFTAERVLAVSFTFPPGALRSLTEANAVSEELVRRVSALPSVDGVALTSGVPLEGETWIDGIARADATSPEAHWLDANFRFVSPSYFTLLGIPIVAGRGFTEADRASHVTVLSQNAVRALWPNDPLAAIVGRPVHLGSDSVYQVTGIVPNVRTSGIEHEGSLTAYTPYWERGSATTLLVRTQRDPASVASAVRMAIRGVSSSVAIARVRTFDQILSRVVAQRRFQLVLIGLFALTALLTASVGIYGVVAHALGRRMNEIGIRLALGAAPSQVQMLVIWEVLRPALAGLLGGIALSLIAGRAIRSLLYEVTPSDPTTIGTVVLVLVATATLACWLPARRTAAMSPSRALRAS